MNKVAVLGHLGDCMETVKVFIQSLVAELAQSATEAIEEVGNVKEDKSEAVPVTILASGWETECEHGLEQYPSCYDIEAPGITANDRAEITIAPESLEPAGACGLCLTNQTLEGKIRIWAARVPSEEITAEYWIESGKE